MIRKRWHKGLAGLSSVLAAALLLGADRDEVPADLDLIPSDGAVMVTIRLADLWAADLVKPLREKMPKEVAVAIAEVEKNLGAAPERIERLTLLAGALAPDGWLVLLGLNKPYDKAKVAALVGENPTEETYKGRSLFVGGGDRAVGLVGPRAYVMGNADVVRSLLDQADAKRDGPLAEGKKLALQKHPLVAAINVPILASQIPELPGEVEALQPLLAAKSATLEAEVGAESRATLRLTFAGAAEAKSGAKALRAGVDLARRALAERKKELAEQPGAPPLGKLIDLAIGGLEGVAVEPDGSAARAVAKAKLDVAAVVPLLTEFARKQRAAAGRVQSVNNLKQIALAMHNYASVHGSLPPAAVFGKDGKPLLSWRVLILPYIEQDKLYKEFHLNEPWDSEHNKKLLDRMPKVFAVTGQKAGPVTHYQGFYGKGAAFEGKSGLRFPAEFPDGTSNTILVVEGAKAVPWTKPEDLPYDPEKPLPKLGGLYEGGFNAAFCDGSVHFLKAALHPHTLHVLIGRNDGEVIGEDF